MSLIGPGVTRRKSPAQQRAEQGLKKGRSGEIGFIQKGLAAAVWVRGGALRCYCSFFALNQEAPDQCSRTGSQHNHPQNQIALVAGGGGARCGGRSGAGDGGSVDPLHVRVAGNLLGDNPSAAVAAVTCIGGGSVVVAAALADIVAGVIGGRSRLNGEFRSRCAGIGNDSQCVLAHRQGFQIFGFQGDNGAAFLYGVVGSIRVLPST